MSSQCAMSADRTAGVVIPGAITMVTASISVREVSPVLAPGPPSVPVIAPSLSSALLTINAVVPPLRKKLKTAGAI